MTRIPFPRSAGLHSRQAHCDLPPGTFEREIGAEGFAGPATQMIHAHPPTAWTRWQGPLRPRAFDLARLEGGAVSPVEAPPLLANPHVALRLWRCAAAMDHLARNGDGDELLFVHAGAGALFCDFGHLALRDGDYVLLPRGTMWRLEPAEPMTLLLIEATGGGFGLPERGLLGRHAPFDPAVLDVPELDESFRAQQGETPWRVRIRRGGAVSTVDYPFNPLDALGWHGDLLPVRLNWRDLRPVVSPRLHLPPSAHTTFVADRVVVSTFVPRPVESDPGALKLPFYHSNVDYDEVLFYHRGSFLSRDDIHPGMLTLHPAGFPHGPHPGARRAAGSRRDTDEVAVMVDSRDRLAVAPAAAAVERPGYADSWREEGG
jgi:homogentisate 1,2-dioxygenase